MVAAHRSAAVLTGRPSRCIRPRLCLLTRRLLACLAAVLSAGKSVRETDSGFIMCRGASSASRLVPLLPVEEQSAEQQADAVVEAADAQLETVVAVGSKFILEEEEDEDGGEDDDSEE